MNNTDYNNAVLERIKKTEALLEQVNDKTAYVYVMAENGLKEDYELVGDKENADRVAKDIIYKIGKKLVPYKNGGELTKLRKCLVHAYDTRARCGDFESFCIALEWKRPIEKQFYIPRMKLMRKHGVTQGIQDLIDDKLDLLVLNLPPRIGKLISNSTPVLTKNGWKKHGDLQVGDYVLNHKGRFVKVLATSPEYQCNCKVTFANGEQIDCHENHEWMVNDRHRNREVILETKSMIGNIRDNYETEKTKNHFRFGLPIIEPILGEYKELPVEPYCLGVWLGDGTNKKNCITIDKNDNIIAETVNKYYPISSLYINKTCGTYTYYFNNLRNDLKKIDMCHSKVRCIKHIPDIYLTASLEQRLQLLAGLLDTDGTLSKKEHRYHYSTTEKQLMEDFMSLISTFGWRCSVSEYEPTLSSSGIQGRKKVYSIGFNPTFEIPCKIERKQLKEFSKQRRITITNIERIENGEMGKCIQVEGGIYLAGSTLIPTHNSTIGLFLQAMLGGLYPDESILGAGHSVSLIQSFYNEILNIINGEEYRYHEIFPNANVVSKSAEYFFIDLNNTKRFHTYNYVSIESGGTGKVQAERLLYCDDLIKGKEQVNNPDVLEKLYYNYTSTIKDRKVQRLCKDGVYRTCPEIHICTPWSLHDVTSRVVQNAKDSGDLDRVRIVSIPCYDENGESNFEYDYGKGFSKEYYKEMELAEDPVIFSAKYLMTPVERDGLVFNKDNVSFYRNLPSRTPDRIVAYADVSHGGEDYFSMPIGYVYDDEVYIEDILFRNKFGGDDYIRPLVKEKLMKNNVSRLGIEKNNGGDFFSTLVDKDLKKSNYRCNITTHNAPTNKSKLDRILACQNEIKGIATETNTYKIYFKLPENIKGDSEYQDAMRQLFNWNQSHSAQSKQHDDFPDSLAGLITNVLNGKTRGVVRSIKGDFLE